MDTVEEINSIGSGGPREDELKLGLHALRMGFRVRLLHHVMSERVTAALAPYKLRPGSLTTMVMIAANPGYSQIELARIGSLDKSSIVAIVDDLEEKGLAVRGRSTSDRRRNSLSLTPAGERLMHEMHSVALATEAPLREGLSPEEHDRLVELLDKAHHLIRSDATP
jgi:DNA-binding MarR family transcriptional regulator